MQVLQNFPCKLWKLILETRMVNTVLSSKNAFSLNFWLGNNNVLTVLGRNFLGKYSDNTSIIFCGLDVIWRNFSLDAPFPTTQLNSDALVLQWCQVSLYYKEVQNNSLSCSLVKKAQSKIAWADAMFGLAHVRLMSFLLYVFIPEKWMNVFSVFVLLYFP